MAWTFQTHSILHDTIALAWCLREYYSEFLIIGCFLMLRKQMLVCFLLFLFVCLYAFNLLYYASFGADCIIPQHHETTRSLLTELKYSVNSTKTSDGKLKCIAVFYKNSLLFQLNATVKTESLLKR